jgi:hypothetical protein
VHHVPAVEDQVKVGDGELAVLKLEHLRNRVNFPYPRDNLVQDEANNRLVHHLLGRAATGSAEDAAQVEREEDADCEGRGDHRRVCLAGRICTLVLLKPGAEEHVKGYELFCAQKVISDDLHFVWT